MRNLRWNISQVLIALGVVLVTVSIYCFWSAYRIKQQQLQKAGDDPFTLVFSDKIQTEATGTGDNEMSRLNGQRLRNENAGWYLIISGVGLLVATSAFEGWRRKSITLNLKEKQ